MAVLMSSCTRPPGKTFRPDATSTYAGVLPTCNDSVYYHRAAVKPGVTSVAADSRVRAWFQSSGKALSVIEQNPIIRKTDLVYLSLPRFVSQF